jgi:hypothetical protein
MSYVPFPALFGEKGWYEMSIVGVGRHPILPPDNYALVEAYCTDKNCDCRRVFINVLAQKRKEPLAVIAYGWESEAYYRKWYGGKDDDLARMVVDEMMGPILNSASPQSKLAPALLELVRDLISKDPAYVARLKRHYQMFKEKVDPKHFRLSGAANRIHAAKPKSKKRKRH